MIRHLRQIARGDGRVARALATRSDGGRGTCAALRQLRSSSEVSDPVPDAAAWSRACRRRRRRRSAISTPPRSQRAIRELLASERFDLIFVHCSSVAQYVDARPRDARRSSTSATWIRRSGSSTRATSRFRCRSATGSKGASSSREERLSRRASISAPATTRAEWETLEGYGTGRADGLVSERRRQRLFRADRRALRPRHDRLRRPHGLLPEPGMHVRLLRARCRCCARSGPRSSSSSSAPIRRRPCAGSATARRDGHRLGAGRAPVSCGALRSWSRRCNIARGTQNKILEAMAMGVPVVTSRSRPAASTPSAASTFSSRRRRTSIAPRSCAMLDDPAERQRLARRRPRADALASRVGRDRCSASTASSSAAWSRGAR